MSARIVTGFALAETILRELRPRVAAVTAILARPPRLALLGDLGKAGARAYADRQAGFARDLGIDVALDPVGSDATTESAARRVADLSRRPDIDGVLPLMPFPAGIDVAGVREAIDPARDVDGLTAVSAGRLALGLPGFAPCTAEAAVLLAESLAGDLSGRDVTVVGASHVVGQPLALMLARRGATVTLCHVATRDLGAKLRASGLVFVAVGKPGLVRGDDLAPGALVIDIGINRITGPDGTPRLVGDVDLASASAVAGIISAVPDGVGPVTTACLMRNVVVAAEARLAGPPIPPSAG